MLKKAFTTKGSFFYKEIFLSFAASSLVEHVGPNKVDLVTIITGQDNHRHHHNDGTRVACDREAVTTHLGADLQLPKHRLMKLITITIKAPMTKIVTTKLVAPTSSPSVDENFGDT